jgi:hypothetical protein
MAILLSDLPGDEPGDGLKRYQQAAADLYALCGSDRAYEDVMNGFAYVTADGQVVYYECEDDYY